MTWQWVVFALIICTTIVIVTGMYFAFRDNTVAGHPGLDERP